jgi:hypothetical protein
METGTNDFRPNKILLPLSTTWNLQVPKDLLPQEVYYNVSEGILTGKDLGLLNVPQYPIPISPFGNGQGRYSFVFLSVTGNQE